MYVYTSVHVSNFNPEAEKSHSIKETIQASRPMKITSFAVFTYSGHRGVLFVTVCNIRVLKY